MEFEDTLKPYLSQEEIQSLLDSFKGKSTHAVLLNTIKTNEKIFLKTHKNVKKHHLVKHAFIYDKDIYPLGKELSYDQGLYSIQDPSAMIPAILLNPNKNDIVLDMCAAPGGKTIQMGLLMENQGILIANDLSFPRAKDLSSNIERVGLGNVIVTSNDFSIAHNFFVNTFDKILLDAPCSGSAMFRKNEQAKIDWSIKKVENCVKIQTQLLESAYLMLKPGGIICYSTCSFSFQENDQQIMNFLSKHKDCKTLSTIKDKSFIRYKDLKDAVHILPTTFEGEGQFCCLIQKAGSSKPNLFQTRSNNQYKALIDKFSLQHRSNEVINSSLYSMSSYFDHSHLNVLRYGIRVMELDNRNIPNHNLSHFLSADDSISLSLEEVKLYIHGDVISIQKPDGFYLVSYKENNLGFVKIVNNIAKNYYPKGLRRVLNESDI